MDPSHAQHGPDEAGGVPLNPQHFQDNLAEPAPYAPQPEPRHVEKRSEVSLGVTGRGVEDTQRTVSMRLGVTETGVGVRWTRAEVRIQPGGREKKNMNRTAREALDRGYRHSLCIHRGRAC
jgi:hypothetical protein